MELADSKSGHGQFFGVSSSGGVGSGSHNQSLVLVFGRRAQARAAGADLARDADRGSDPARRPPPQEHLDDRGNPRTARAGFCRDPCRRHAGAVDGAFEVPASEPELAPMLLNIPLQLLAYHVALKKGCDIDKPRNLAKSVTVE